MKTLTTHLMSKTMRQPRVAAIIGGRVITPFFACGEISSASLVAAPIFGGASKFSDAGYLGAKLWSNVGKNAGKHHGLCHAAGEHS